jgi:phosphoribosylanthranilate isomerase
VKVCGITTEVARDAAIEAGADALGFVLVEASPRHRDPGRIARLIAGCPIDTYVLVAESAPERAVTIVEDVGATGIQPYGPTAARTILVAVDRGLDVLVPIPVRDGFPVDSSSAPAGTMPLFDTADPERLGGTGRAFDWRLLSGLDRAFVLAGGLGPDNVAEAISVARPFGVDASSRLETEPGVKDPDTIRIFVQEAKAI